MTERFNQFGRDIPNDELTLEDVPEASAPWGMSIAFFALTYDGYEQVGSDRVTAVADAARQAYSASGILPDSLDDLRTCLFFEQRRYHWRAEPPDAESDSYIRGLVKGIRDCVAEGAV